MNAPAVLELPLDDALLKVLSSESRREILRLLRERRMTGAELATRLDLGKPAVAEHLKKLQEAELIERFDDPERRWVYYNLSSRGRGILEPQRVRFYLVMAVAALALMVGVALALGVVVLMQGHDNGAADALAGPLDASGADGSLGQPGVANGGTLASTLPGTVAWTTTSSNSSPAPVADRVVQGPARAPTPVGNVSATAPRVVPQTVFIDENSPTFAFRSTSGEPVGNMVLAYRPQDVDQVNHTVRLHFISLNASALAAANLTESVLAAKSQTGAFLLQVPDGIALPEEANSTAILSIQEPDLVTVDSGNVTVPAATVAPVQNPPSGAPASGSAAGGAVTPVATPAATPVASPAAMAATNPTPTVMPTSIPLRSPLATPSPVVTHGSVKDGQGTAANDLDASVPGAQAQGAPMPTPVSTSRASIPLVSLLAAALMVSIYLPNRRKET